MQITLTDDERQTLERWAQRPRSSQVLALRCRIVLACAQGMSNVEAGAQLVHPVTVGSAAGSPPAGWRGWRMSRGRACPDQSPIPRSSR